MRTPLNTPYTVPDAVFRDIQRKQEADTALGPYYISVMKDNGDWRAVSGPYPLHATALGLVDKARRICEQMDARTTWYAFGTVRIKDTCTDPGILQKSGYNLALEREAA